MKRFWEQVKKYYKWAKFQDLVQLHPWIINRFWGFRSMCTYYNWCWLVFIHNRLLTILTFTWLSNKTYTLLTKYSNRAVNLCSDNRCSTVILVHVGVDVDSQDSSHSSTTQPHDVTQSLVSQTSWTSSAADGIHDDVQPQESHRRFVLESDHLALKNNAEYVLSGSNSSS